jgi:hypothetical protein
MEEFKPYEVIKTLGDENTALREKIIALEKEMEFLKGCNKELNWFKDNFGLQQNEKPTNVVEVIDSPKQTYDDIRNEYFIENKVETLITLFEEFPDRIPDTLSSIRFELPDNINDLANKYNFVEELRIIKISNEKINELKTDPTYHEEWNLNNLESEYIKNFNQGRKKAAMKYVRQVLIYFPFTINKFLDNIRAYKFDDLDEAVETMKGEIYYGKEPVKKSAKKLVSKVTGGKNFRPDYATTSIDELVEFIKKVDAGHRTARIKNILLKLTENNRTIEECNLFKQMTKDLVYSKYNVE